MGYGQKNNYRISKVGEIPRNRRYIRKYNPQNPNDDKDYQELKTLTIGAPVGDKGSAVMIAKDKILLLVVNKMVRVMLHQIKLY